jgi:nicotinamide mononucleotide transporter
LSGLLSVNTVFFTLLGYPMSYIEFAGTVLYLWSVWLITKRNVLTWPIGILSVVLYFALFYQIRLYSDALEQVYYLGASAYGWWYWSKSQQEDHVISDVTYSSARAVIVAVGVTAALSVALGYATSRVHVWAPALFPEAASFPYLDAVTTVMSFTAMWLMARKRIESWVYWIVVDVIGIWLYFVKDVRFISMLYVVLLFLAVRGLADWRRARARVTQLAQQAGQPEDPDPGRGVWAKMKRSDRRHTGADFGKTSSAGGQFSGMDGPMIGAAASILVDGIAERESGVTPPPPPVSVRTLAIVFAVMFIIGVVGLWLAMHFLPGLPVEVRL